VDGSLGIEGKLFSKALKEGGGLQRLDGKRGRKGDGKADISRKASRSSGKGEGQIRENQMQAVGLYPKR